MLVHHRVTPGSMAIAGTHLYTWVERDNVGQSILSKEYCGSVLSLVHFLLSFVLYSLSYITMHAQKQRKIKIEPRIKLNHNVVVQLILCSYYIHQAQLAS